MRSFSSAVLLVFLQSAALAATPMRVGSSDFPPYTIEKGFVVSSERKVGECLISPGTYYGIDVDFVGEVLSRAKIPFKIEYHSWTRAKELLQNRELSLLPGLLYDESQSKNLLFVPYDSGGSTIVLMRKEMRPVSKRPSDLRKLRVGTVRDDKYGSSFDEAKRRGEFSVEPRYAAMSDEENLRNLASARVDVAVINTVVGKYLLQSLGLHDKIKIAPFKFSYGNGEKSGSIYLALHRGVDVGLVEKIRSSVSALKSEKRLECIRERYGISSND